MSWRPRAKPGAVIAFVIANHMSIISNLPFQTCDRETIRSFSEYIQTEIVSESVTLPGNYAPGSLPFPSLRKKNSRNSPLSIRENLDVAYNLKMVMKY